MGCKTKRSERDRGGGLEVPQQAAFWPRVDCLEGGDGVQNDRTLLSSATFRPSRHSAALEVPGVRSRDPGLLPMGQVVSAFYSWFNTDKEYKVLLIGLDNAGKTTTLYQLHLGQAIETQPTIGSNVETVKHKNVHFEVNATPLLTLLPELPPGRV